MSTLPESTRNLLVFLLLLPALVPAWAQPYPSKPIRLVVPTTPGGGTDVTARVLARAMSERLGQQVVVDNRGGASGRIGSESVARSAPDGYTLLMGGVTPLATIPSSDSKLAYDPVNDFAPISLAATTQYTLVVHPSLPVKSVKELVALGRAKPGQVSFSSVGTGSTAHFTAELLKQLAKVDYLHVPYKGSGPAITAVLSGEVSFYFGSGPSILPHAKAGRLRPLATTGPKRAMPFPELPTTGESVPGHVSTSWYGVLAPAGTPSDIVTKLHGVIVSSLGNPTVAKQVAAAGADPLSSSPQEFAAHIKAELAKWSKVVKAGGIKAE
jgi:tripartite-type tricarboxylate transporter receptor subunit TctC